MTTIAAATTAPALIAEIPTADDSGAVNDFLHKWDEAWAKHDALAIAPLHTDDAVTVNRFGTVVRGREDLAKALGFLHGIHGPFHNSVFPSLELLIQRSIAPNVQAVQAMAEPGNEAGWHHRPRIDQRHDRHLYLAQYWRGVAGE